MPELESMRREQIGSGRVRYERRSELRRSELLPWYQHTALGALRVVAGIMLVQHGVQKHFGLLASPDMPPFHAPVLFTQMWWAGTLEIAGGALLALGLFTRVVAFVLSGELAVAYWVAHAPRGPFPILNRGELAALYCFVFLLFAAIGGGRYSIDALIARRRRK